MTENMRKFLAAVSKNDELTKKINTMTKEELIALAKELGVDLTDADFAEPTNELSDDELDAVAGGADCGCFIGGGGEGGGKWDNKVCVCVTGGGGQTSDGGCRCACTVAGWGAE